MVKVELTQPLYKSEKVQAVKSIQSKKAKNRSLKNISTSYFCPKLLESHPIIIYYNDQALVHGTTNFISIYILILMNVRSSNTLL